MIKFKNKKLYFIIPFVIYISFKSSFIYSNNKNENKNIVFNWSFVSLIVENNNKKIINVNKDMILKTGDQLKIMINNKSECFVYILYHGSNGEFMSLYPLKQNESHSNTDGEYYMPAGNLWFSLDEHSGRETFYLIAAKSRLDNLEILIDKYKGAGFEEKANIASQIVEEIKNVKRMHKKFTANAERPIQIGGSIRGSKDQPQSGYDISDFEVEITATDFYSRTFTIEHK